MQKYSQTGLSLPNEVLLKKDTERGDLSRSRYILRQLEKVLQTAPISPKKKQSVESPNGSESNG